MAVNVHTDHVEIGGKHALVQIAYLNISTATTTEVVAAVSGKKIRATAVTLSAGGDNTAQFKSAANALGGVYTFKGGGGMDVDRTPPNYFLETNAGEALNITTSAAQQLSGSLNYVVV